MTKIFFYTLILSICFAAPCFSQKYDNIWLLGKRGVNPFPDIGNAFLQFPLDTSTFHKEPLGRADTDYSNIAICNEEGTLQFYTDGLFLYNKMHQKMAGTDSLTHGELAYFDQPQRAIVLPRPGYKNKYLIFHQTTIGLTFNSQNFLVSPDVRMTEVDMDQNIGLGKVTIKEKKVITDTVNNGQVSAVKHGNGRDWWLLSAVEITPTNFRRLLIAKDSIFESELISTGIREYVNKGQCTFSHDGSMYASCSFYGLSPNFTVYLDVYDFDRCSGELTWRGQDIYQGLYPACGVAFSPDSKLLYLSLGRKLMQYDMSQEQYQSTRMEIDTFDGFHDPIHTTFFMLQNAPDGKIYMSATNTVRYLHVINDPNIRGIGCNFKQHSLKLPVHNNFGVPNYPNYRLGPLKGSPCDTLPVVSTDTEGEIPLSLSPNPVSDELQIGYDLRGDYQHSEAEVWDMQGRLMLRQPLDSYQNRTSLSTRDWLPGIYAVRIVRYGSVLAWDKVVKR
ncbi:MAG: hypothetical protein IPQ18_06175 [Saprospiraceae bacterium]|nr:hypothetical protein [Saprospiraceae bacterium]